MVKDAGRLKNLIDSILEISALEQKKVTHEYHVYKMGELINRVVSESREQFTLTGNEIIINGDPDCECVVDKAALKIVIDNLVDNAIKYSAGNPIIKIRMFSDEKYFILEFEDNGIGIPVKERKKVFSKFYRIYNKDIPTVKGTGLGLYWVKGIIKNFGGSIALLSEGRQTGSTFRIELPIYESVKKRYINKLLELTRRKTKQMEKDNE
jgi:signal transduction histidine kinase